MKLEFAPSQKPDAFGHHFIVGLSGTELDDRDKRILAKVRPAALLLLKRNFDHTLPYGAWLEKLEMLITSAANYAERDALLVTLDHEGERVHRVPPPLTIFPNAVKYASHAAAVAKAMATELKSIGVHLSWAPDADIHSNPQNPIIGPRAFGSDAYEVAEIAVEFYRSLASEGILGCAKHFPGHGDTSTDSHLELPTLDIGEELLRARELVPFVALLAAGVPMVMTAHILFPQIDPHYPATFSERVLKRFLRDEMQYQGLIVADDLYMKAVAKAFEQPETFAKSIHAGCDLFIVSRFPEADVEHMLGYARMLGNALQQGLVKEDDMHRSFNRISQIYAPISRGKFSQLSGDTLQNHADLAAELRR
jgi:beta-N-acetylhexosaminidase